MEIIPDNFKRTPKINGHRKYLISPVVAMIVSTMHHINTSVIHLVISLCG